MIQTTIDKEGLRLPVGVESAPGGARDRSFAFRAWSAKEEIAIGDLRDRNRAAGPAEQVTHVLSTILRKWGPHDFEKMSEPEKILALKRSFAADVYFAWVQLRRDVIGNGLDMALACPCREEFVFEVDLGTLDVDAVADGEDLNRPFQLRDGFEFRGAVRKVLTLSPLRWGTYEEIGVSTGLNPGKIKVLIALGAIVGVDGLAGEIKLPENALDALSKFDLENLSDEIEVGQPGPFLSFEVACPKCKSKTTRAISWVYDRFFSKASSRSGRRRKSFERSSSSATGSPDSPTT